MKLRLERKWLTAVSTVGELYLDGRFECYTLELPIRDGKPGTAIPAGTYELRLDPSPRFLMDMPELFGIPGRSTILIHWGNTAADTEGCILVGQTQQPNFVGHSRIAFKRLLAQLGTPETKHEIEVVDAPPPPELGVEETVA
ncbi:MAG: DUF5675 family protein [Pyrinomonadaceae bacterium]